MYLVLVLNKEKEGIKGQSSLQDKKEDSRDCSAFESVDREVLLTRKMSCQDTAGVQRGWGWRQRGWAGLQRNVSRELYATQSNCLLGGLSLVSQGTKTAVIKLSSSLLGNLM